MNYLIFVSIQLSYGGTTGSFNMLIMENKFFLKETGGREMKDCQIYESDRDIL
jgi:hypothetical protein